MKKHYILLIFILLKTLSISYGQVFNMCQTTTSSNSLTGTLYDSGGPNMSYQNNERCSFSLTLPSCADSIRLTIRSLALESCCDYLTIYAGSSNTSPVLFRSSSTNGAMSFKTTSSNVFIEFSSDGSVAYYSGFDLTWQAYVNNQPSSASFSASSSTPAINDNVSFSNQSVNMRDYLWKFGDGATSNLRTPVHAYTTSGSKTVQLIGVSCNGFRDTFEQVLNVQLPPVAVPSTSVSVTATCGQSATVNFSLTNSGLGDLIYRINNTNFGVIRPNAVANLTGQLSTANLSAGIHQLPFAIQTNDPFRPTAYVLVSLTLQAAPKLEKRTGCINLGVVKPNDTLNVFLPIKNIGCTPLTYTIRPLNAHRFSLVAAGSGTVPNYSTGNASIRFIAGDSLGLFSSRFIITTNGGIDTVCLQAEVINIYKMCDRTTNVSSSSKADGILFDSGGPTGNYSAYEYCYFQIGSICMDSVKFTLVSLDTENCCDSLIVSNSLGYISPYNARHGLITSPISFISRGSFAQAQFQSNYTNQGAGFELRWHAYEKNVPVSANINTWGSNTPALNTSITFNSYNSTNAIEYLWDFGDGTTSTDSYTSHAYTTSGLKRVRLIAIGCRGARDTAWLNINVQAAPVASIATTTLNISIPCNSSVDTFVVIRNTGTGDLIYTADNNTNTILPSTEGRVRLRFYTSWYSNGMNRIPVIVTTNDPLNPTITVTVNLNIIATPVLSLSPNVNTCINLGEFNLSQANIGNVFSIRNTGCLDLRYSITSLNPLFVITSTSSGTVSSYNTQPINFSVRPTALGTFTGRFVVNTNGGIDTICYQVDITNNTNMCTSTMATDTTGVLCDQGGRNNPYSSNSNCSFLISPNCATAITLNISEFSTETSYDYLNIYDGTNRNARMIGRYSGNLQAFRVTSGPNMFLEFISNNSVNYSGFRANWTTTRANSIATSFVLNSTNLNTGQPIVFNNTSTSNLDLASATILWEFGDGTSSNQFNATHTYTQVGSYNVTLTVSSCGIISRSSQPIIILGTESISASKFSFTASPNPFTEQTQLNFNLSSTEEVSLIIYDLLGNKVISLLDNQSLNAGTHKYDFAHPTSGVYFAFLTSKNGSSVIKLIKSE